MQRNNVNKWLPIEPGTIERDSPITSDTDSTAPGEAK